MAAERTKRRGLPRAAAGWALLLLALALPLAPASALTPAAEDAAAAAAADAADAAASATGAGANATTSPAPRFYPNSTESVSVLQQLQQQQLHRTRTRRPRNAAAAANALAGALSPGSSGSPFSNATLLPGRRTAVLDAQGQFYFRNGTAVPREVSAAALRRAAFLGGAGAAAAAAQAAAAAAHAAAASDSEALSLRPSSPLDGAREATSMGVYGAAPVKLQYPGEPSFNGITGPLGSIDYDDGDGAECFRYLPGCLACDKFFTVAPGVGALFQYRCLACLTPEYVLNGIKCECGPGFGVPATLGLSGGPKPSRGSKFGYGGQATMFTSCQRCPGNFFLDPAFSADGATLGPACMKCPRNTKAMPDQSGCECSPGAAPINRPGIQETTGLTLAPPRCVMCPAGTYVPSPNRGNYGCVPCHEGSTTPPGRFGMISTRANGNGKDTCNWCLPGYAGNNNVDFVPGTAPPRRLIAGSVCVPCADDEAQQLTLRSEVLCSEEEAADDDAVVVEG